MLKKNQSKGLIEQGWLQMALALLGILVLFWLRRRVQRKDDAVQPVIWRRDIEMGPQGEMPGQATEEMVAATRQAASEPNPDLDAGSGSIAAPGESQAAEPPVEPESTGPGGMPVADMEAGEGFPVTGPVPSPDLVETGTPGGDDLEILEGIGPRINTVLQEAGIRTFARLAETSVADLQRILEAAGLKRINNPESWPEQSRLAAEGDWSGLDNLKKTLKGGRKK